jgi:hypothetical protein
MPTRPFFPNAVAKFSGNPSCLVFAGPIHCHAERPRLYAMQDWRDPTTTLASVGQPTNQFICESFLVNIKDRLQSS